MLNQSVLQRAILATVLAIFNVSVVANIELPEDEKPEKKIEALRVCADPGNMPMSNDKGEGYANRIAKIIADGLGTHVTYFYRPYLNRGLTRQTFDNNECDILMDMTADDERMLTTIPVYKSTFVLAYRNDKGIDIKSLDDPKLLNDYKVGVFQHSAIRTVLQEHGIKRENTVVRTIAHDADLRPERQPHMDVQLMLDGKLDVAALWGPMAGWYKTIKKEPVTIVPVNLMDDKTPMEFALAIGMRKNAKDLKQKIEAVMLKEKDSIKKVFDDYGVPLVKCDECVVSGNLPSHGAYKPIVRKAIVPAQSDVATLPAMIDEALKQGSSLEQELHNATIARDSTRIEYLLKRGAKVDAKDTEGQTPLMVAAKGGDLSVINGLLEYKANPNAQDNDGWTVAMHAVRSNEPKIFRLLGKHKADFNLINKDGLTALAMAVHDNKANAAVAMLDNNANPDFAMGAAKYNALMLAVTKGNLTLAQTLLQYKANPNATNAGGVTPLMIAAHRNHDMIVSLLLKAGAKVDVKDDEGKTALMIAKENDAKNAVIQLEKSL
ncbi:MAG: quinoprotein dehydrogenase-associated putative ABC transporter substrate-binding protein [Methylotenera sp.]|nr:quinoprotein dehydrogenase-associated putative ABC transporter substrate-binding protein [Methylotenera sp.]